MEGKVVNSLRKALKLILRHGVPLSEATTVPYEGQGRHPPLLSEAPQCWVQSQNLGPLG